MIIDFTLAPGWARYHAFDSDGIGYWYDEVTLGALAWVPDTQRYQRSSYTLPAGVDWKKSLVEKPS